MSLYMAAFMGALTVACGRLWFTDERNFWAGLVILSQTLTIYLVNRVTGYQPLPCAIIYLVAAVTFLWFSTRDTGAGLGILSAMMCIVMVLGAFGLIPAETGKGLAHTVWHHSTVLAWMQLGILWMMGHGIILRWPY